MDDRVKEEMQVQLSDLAYSVERGKKDPLGCYIMFRHAEVLMRYIDELMDLDSKFRDDPESS